MQEIIQLIYAMSPYLLLGFLMAGVMHAFVPQRFYRRYLSRPGFRSVLHAALLGIPLPLCSCGVIPTAMSLRREGASRGAVVSFLTATPQTGIDSIAATGSLLGWPFALLRPVAALCTALLGGWFTDTFQRDDDCPTPLSTEGCSDEKCGCTSDTHPLTFRQKCVEALHYAFVEMMQDIGKWLIIGLVVAGLITLYVPDSFFALFAGQPLLSILFVLLFSIPMYLCATGSIPIAVALMLKGLTPGAALVLLMAGPASNAASILVIRKVLGSRTLLLYLLSIVGGAIGFALVVDYLLPAAWFTLPLAPTAAGDCCHTSPTGTDYLGLSSTLLLALLLLHAFARARWSTRHTTSEQHTPSAHVHRYHIEGMECNHCRNNVEQAIRSIPGVTQVTVTLADGQAQVEGQYDEALLLQAVRQLGFEVV